LNKELTGCGATTIALTDKHPTIICSPRNELIKNWNYSLLFVLKIVAGSGGIIHPFCIFDTPVNFK